MKSSYDVIKEHIQEKLKKMEQPLQLNDIQHVIEQTKEIMDTVGIDIFAKVLMVDKLSTLTEEDWKRINNELETFFNVKMNNAIILQGKEQRNRNTLWWTSNPKLNERGYYWNRYKEHIKESLPPDVIRGIDEDTDKIMDNIENPELDYFSRYGMVVGHVQSGKTSNYAALLCKAADAGYKFIVVIAGAMNNLRNQTQERLNEAFIGKIEGKLVGVGKLGDLKNEMIPISLTTPKLDFNKRDADKSSQGYNFDNINSPVVLVIKKNQKTLTNVIGWLKDQYKAQIPIEKHAMLLIDDESDYASINTKEEDSPAAINKSIRELISLFKKSAYVAYTATPYANIFIDHKVNSKDLGKDLFPKDFICALDAPDNYFGAKKIFIKDSKKYVREIDDFKSLIPLDHKKDSILQDLPESLKEAIHVFIINIAVRRMRGQENKHNSMLIHITRFTQIHRQVALLVKAYLKEIREAIDIYGMLPDAEQQSEYIQLIRASFNKEFDVTKYIWRNVLDNICDTIDSLIVKEVHKDIKARNRLEYEKDRGTNVIVIGGTSLARGYTLEGLSVSYFLRSTIFYDTLMQMGRWFGYRIGYEDLCRVYMTREMLQNFRTIIEATDDLMDSLKDMEEAKMTPEDFGLAVQQHPDSLLQVTARNKQKNAQDIYFTMNLDGQLKETAWLSSDINDINHNIECLKEIVNQLGDIEFEKIGNKYLWRDVKKEVIHHFISQYIVYTRNDAYGLKSRMPIEFIKKYVEEIETKWDVALYSGSVKKEFEINSEVLVYPQERGLTPNGDYYMVDHRQVSSGAAEGIVFHPLDLGSKRKEIRARMEKPLLMLHILQSKEDSNVQICAFGVSFPGGINSGSKTVVLKVNTVYIEELLRQEEYDDR